MKLYILILSIVLLISTINATLTINPNPMTINQKIGELKNYNIEFKNQHQFKIMDFTFSELSNYGFSFPSITLEPNQTKNITFNATPTSSFHGNINSKVSFKYIVTLPSEPQTYTINITPIGYKPNYLVIKKGDTISWINNDDISHTVTSANFDQSLQPGQTFSYVYNNIGNFNYQDLIMFFSGTINVVNQSTDEKAHNPNYDYSWTIDFNALLNPTTLEVVLLDQYFNLSATSQTEGSLRLKNTGNELAEIINLLSDSNWITFKENKFNLAKNEQKYVNYIIKPSIFDSNETNKTYNLLIKTKASNTEEYTRNISLFVPYSDVFKSLNTEEGFMIWFAEVYCPAHPNLFLCNTSVGSSSGTNITIIRDPEIPINISLITWYEMRKDIQKLKDSAERTDNQIKLIADKWGISIPELMGLVNQSVQLQTKNERKNQDRWDAIWILGGGVIIILMIVVTINHFLKKQYREYLSEGQFKYKR